MNYAALKKTDVANGPGIRVSLFVSGCTHRCRGCFNAEAWDFSYGEPYTEETAEEVLAALAPPHIRGLSILGGEPLEPANRPQVLELVKRVRAAFPQKDIWCYTGYTYEKDLLKWAAEGASEVVELLSLLDVLVDGEFVEEEKDLRLAFRGSRNQRLIDVGASLSQGVTVLLRME